VNQTWSIVSSSSGVGPSRKVRRASTKGSQFAIQRHPRYHIRGDPVASLLSRPSGARSLRSAVLLVQLIAAR